VTQEKEGAYYTLKQLSQTICYAVASVYNCF